MGVLADHQIEKEVKIVPMFPCEKREGRISNGLTSYGYDATLGYKFRVPTPHRCTGMVLDPKNPNPLAFEDVDLFPGHQWQSVHIDGGGVPYESCWACGALTKNVEELDLCQHTSKPNFIVVPPQSLVLGETVEEFTIPRDILCVVLGKSTYARNGIVVNVTPGEPEWTGKWTVEISNTSPLPVKVYCGEGIMQCLFLRADGPSGAVLEAVRRLCNQHTRDAIRSDGGYFILDQLEAIEKMLHHDLPRSLCRTSYADKKGKYQTQPGLTLSKADEKETK